MTQRSLAVRISQCRRWGACLLVALAPLSVSQAASQPRFDLATIETLLSHARPGDTVVYLDDMAFEVEDLLRQKALLSPAGGRAPRSATEFGVKTWPNGRVPYAYDSGVTSSERSAFEAACRVWEAVVSVHFVPADQFDTDRLVVYDANDNSSYVGVQGGSQPVHIYNWNYKYIICHELGHALGMSHEQSRSDRDTYVTIHTENVEAGMAFNFDKLSTTNTTPYDFDSVMHYGRTAFSVNGQDTITPKPAYTAAASTMGQTDHLSNYDVKGMSGLYGATAELAMNYLGHTVHDGVGGGAGNGDAIANPGESVALGIEVLNAGEQSVTNIQAYLSTTNKDVVIGNGKISLPALAPGGSETGGNFTFSVSSSAGHGEVIPFQLTFVSDQGWVDRTFPVTVANTGSKLADIQLAGVVVDDNTSGGRSGDGDGVPDAGETVGLIVTLQNTSNLGEETNVNLHASETSAWASLTVADLKFSTLSSGMSTTRNGLELKISEGTPGGTEIPLTFTLTSDQATWTVTHILTVPKPIVATPVISPPGGSYNNPPLVTLSTSTPGASIHYTTDGSTPTSSSPLYSAPFTPDSSIILRVVGTKDGFVDSEAVVSFSIATPSPGFNETLGFDDNQTPPGWKIDVPEAQASSALAVNGRFEVRPPDISAGLQRDKQLPPDAIGIRAEYRGNIANNPDGMGGGIHLIMQNGDDYFVSLAKAGNLVNEVTATAGKGSPAPWQQSFTPDYGIYRVKAEFRDGEIKFSATKEGTSAPLFTNTIPIPGLDVQQVATVRFSAFATDGDPGWMDDLSMTALFDSASVPHPTPQPLVAPQKPSALKAARITSAGGKIQMAIAFKSPDDKATLYQIEARSLSPSGKWSSWKTAKRLPADGSVSYVTLLRLKKASAYQIRVTASNTAGKSVSRPLTIKAASLAKPSH